MENAVVCDSCKAVSNTYEAFLDISLEVKVTALLALIRYWISLQCDAVYVSVVWCQSSWVYGHENNDKQGLYENWTGSPCIAVVSCSNCIRHAIIGTILILYVYIIKVHVNVLQAIFTFHGDYVVCFTPTLSYLKNKFCGKVFKQLCTVFQQMWKNYPSYCISLDFC